PAPAPAPPRAAAPGPPAEAPAPAPALSQPATAAAVARAPVGRLDLDGVRGVWPAVLATVKAQSLLHAMTFEAFRPIACEDGVVTLAFAPEHAFHRRKAEDGEFQKPLIAAFADLLGQRPRFAFEMAEVESEPEVPLTDEELVGRLVAEFAAEEIVPDEEEAGS
ncbi:MAG TPA: hypothetical protein VD931_12445, partial [Baekduia sp.]|nr:hypothetical protein [Baekduia sp.]